jgi:chitinase
VKIVPLLAIFPAELCAQWITGFYQPGGGPTGEPVSAIPWAKYTHMQLWSAGAANTNDGRVCLGYLAQADINSFLAGKPVGKKALVVIADATAGSHGADGITCGGGNTWVIDTSPAAIGFFVQNIVDFVNQTGQSNGGFDGVDLDWESSINSSNYTQYVELIRRLRAAMPGKVINIDVFPGGPTAAAAAAQASLDQVNVMCYDAGNYASWSWHNGPIYNPVVNNGTSCSEKMFQSGRDNGAVTAGVSRAKIGVGIPFYGYRWSGCTQPMMNGCTRQKYFSYGILAGDATRWQSQYQHYDTTNKSNYLSIPGLNEFDTFNGVEFMSDVAAWARANGFGGFMTFGQHDEYVSSASGDPCYPLSTALYNAVFGNGVGQGDVANFQTQFARVGRHAARAEIFRSLIWPGGLFLFLVLLAVARRSARVI